MGINLANLENVLTTNRKVFSLELLKTNVEITYSMYNMLKDFNAEKLNAFFEFLENRKVPSVSLDFFEYAEKEVLDSTEFEEILNVLEAVYMRKLKEKINLSEDELTGIQVAESRNLKFQKENGQIVPLRLVRVYYHSGHQNLEIHENDSSITITHAEFFEYFNDSLEKLREDNHKEIEEFNQALKEALDSGEEVPEELENFICEKFEI